MRRLILPVCLWLCAIASVVSIARADNAPAATADAPNLQLVLDLTDGSRIMGTPSIEKLKLTTKYADMEVQLALVHGIEFKGTDHTAQVNLLNGDVLNAKLSTTEIGMDTLVGKVTIPVAQIRRIRVGVGGRVLPDGAVLHYTFAGTKGDKVADTSGSGNDATIKGATYSADSKAMAFEGNQQQVVAKNPANMQVQDFTIMAWIKHPAAEKDPKGWDNGIILAYGHGGYGMGVGRDGRLFVTKVAVDAVFSTCVINDDAYHQVVVTKRGSKIEFYLDGVPDANVGDYETSFEFGSGAVAVGAVPDDTNQAAGFIGLIREVAVFNRALSDGEIKEIGDSRK